jgi:xylan 1,4-beta-xylosidase
MDNNHELISFPEGIPARLTSTRLMTEERRWQQGLGIYLVLDGELHAVGDEREHLLGEDDLIVFNPGSLYTLRSSAECVFLSLTLDLELLAPHLLDGRFNCSSSTDGNKSRYYAIKHFMALLVKENSSPSEQGELQTKALIFSLLHELQRNFWQGGNAPLVPQKHQQRLDALLDDVHARYHEGLTLAGLAERHHLSAPYLSAFFEKHMGMTFSAFYNDLRIRHAIHDLLATDASVEHIALSNGFSDPRSFVSFFKRRYGELPSQYRKLKRQAKNNGNSPHQKIDEQESFLQVLAKYLPAQPGDSGQATDMDADTPYGYTKTLYVEGVNALSSIKSLRHTFKKITSVGRAKELLLADVQAMIREWQEDIGFEYIIFHGLFSDEMHVYREDSLGRPNYSFVMIDKVFDFLISIGLKPIVQFSFMPLALASNPDRNVYSLPFNVSPPKDNGKWNSLVKAFMEHIADRYGPHRIKSWMYTIWNEPDTAETLFGFPRDEDFYRFYEGTYQTVKCFSANLQVGSPAMLISCNENKDWLLGFLGWTKANQCFPDWLNIHYYDNDFTWESLGQHKPANPSHGRLNRDENSFRRTVAQMLMLKKDIEMDIPIYITEWNLTVSHRNLLNDTSFKSCYLAKNLLENYDEVDAFGYWTLTDLIEETQPSADIFHGGLGLYTYNGIKKPHYHTLRYISRLGGELLAKGDGYFITKSYGAIQVMLYNYEHFNHLFASGESFDMTYKERYTPFSKLGKMDVSVELVNLPSRSCVVREHTINQQHGSAFDLWLAMGGLPLRGGDIPYLAAASLPKLQIYSVEINAGVLSFSAALEPLEVRFIEIELM